MRESELLFPSTLGGYRAPSCLDKPIREIASAAKIGNALTPHFMRRTSQDLRRAASVQDFVVRAIAGHPPPRPSPRKKKRPSSRWALESGRRDLNPRRPPWQGGTLPLS